VGNPLFEGLGLAPLRVHVVRIKIPALAGVENDVGFGDGPAAAAAPEADFKFLECEFFHDSNAQ
jgi:hypothetical protein